MFAALVWLVLAQPGQGLSIDFTQKDQAVACRFQCLDVVGRTPLPGLIDRKSVV